jgi:malonyl-CoA/methylmalonyl-CoA synthetase
VALPSEEWGETIAAVIVGKSSGDELKLWLKDKLAPYKIPRQFLNTQELPRNAMGKVLKGQVKEMF